MRRFKVYRDGNGLISAQLGFAVDLPVSLWPEAGIMYVVTTLSPDAVAVGVSV